MKKIYDMLFEKNYDFGWNNIEELQQWQKEQIKKLLLSELEVAFEVIDKDARPHEF